MSDNRTKGRRARKNKIKKESVLDTKTTEDVAGALQEQNPGSNASLESESSEINTSSQPEYVECNENMDISSPATTPHRALSAFNESVEYAAAEDLRDLLPEESHWMVALSPTAETSEAEDEGQSKWERTEAELNVSLPTPLQKPQPAPHQEQKQQLASHQEQKQQPASHQEQKQQPAPHQNQKQQPAGEGNQLELRTDECVHVLACPVGISVDGVAVTGEGGRDARYEYGPTYFAGKRHSAGLLWRLTGSDSSAARGMRPSSPKSSGGLGYDRHRSAVELAETWLRAQLYHLSSDENIEDSTAVFGALSYVLRALLGLYYHVFVYLPLLTLQSGARFLWAATSTGLALAYVGACWLVSAYVWLLFLPLRLTQRCVWTVCQCTLDLSTALFNIPTHRREVNHKVNGNGTPAGELYLETGADVGTCPNKDVIPTA